MPEKKVSLLVTHQSTQGARVSACVDLNNDGSETNSREQVELRKDELSWTGKFTSEGGLLGKRCIFAVAAAKGDVFQIKIRKNDEDGPVVAEDTDHIRQVPEPISLILLDAR